MKIVRLCNLRNKHHAGYIDSFKQRRADLQLVALLLSHSVKVK